MNFIGEYLLGDYESHQKIMNTVSGLRQERKTVFSLFNGISAEVRWYYL